MLEKIIDFDLWLIFGFCAQFVFFSRFVVQWLYTEKHKTSLIPVSFWYLSIVGAIMILIYALHIKDPVFIVGQGFALLIYLRNLHFIRIEKNKTRKIDN